MNQTKGSLHTNNSDECTQCVVQLSLPVLFYRLVSLRKDDNSFDEHELNLFLKMINTNETRQNTALQMIVHNIRSLSENIACNCLLLLNKCFEKCDRHVRSRLMSSEFLVRLVNINDPKCINATKSEVIKIKVTELIQNWMKSAPSSVNIQSAYSMLKKIEEPDYPFKRPKFLIDLSKHQSELENLRFQVSGIMLDDGTDRILISDFDRSLSHRHDGLIVKCGQFVSVLGKLKIYKGRPELKASEVKLITDQVEQIKLMKRSVKQLTITICERQFVNQFRSDEVVLPVLKELQNVYANLSNFTSTYSKQQAVLLRSLQEDLSRQRLDNNVDDDSCSTLMHLLNKSSLWNRGISACDKNNLREKAVRPRHILPNMRKRFPTITERKILIALDELVCRSLAINVGPFLYQPMITDSFVD
ncbi:hypothetical protein GJ496_009239 [Pomphorhynchus laevis]|nr:hypothetical protein GJ496_009239 [Pomphorhynchus laevis]